MKFSQLLRGKRAEKPVELPYLDENGEEQLAKCLVVPLTGLEEAEVLQFAREYAKGKGIDGAREGEPLFDLAYMVKSLELGCLDLDSPKSAREPFFDGGVDQALAELGREGIAFLFQRQQRWQDECSPQLRTVSGDQLLKICIQLAEAADDGPFSRLSPALQWISSRFMAQQLLASPEASSALGLPSDSSGASSRKTTASESVNHTSPSSSSTTDA